MTFNLETNSEGFLTNTKKLKVLSIKWWSYILNTLYIYIIQPCSRGGLQTSSEMFWAHYEGLFASDLQHYEELSSARPSLNWEAWECNAVAAVSGGESGESGESPRLSLEKAERGFVDPQHWEAAGWAARGGANYTGGLPNILLSSEIITINIHMLLVVFNDSNNSNTIFI